MSLNFPASPAPGQVFTAEGVTFIWNGTVWLASGAAAIPWASPAEAVAGARGDVVMSPLTTKAALDAINPKIVAWGRFNGSALTTQVAKNLTIARTATGDFTFTMPEPMPDTNYAPFVNSQSIVGAAAIAVTIVSPSQFTVAFRRADTDVAGNPTEIFVQVLA